MPMVWLIGSMKNRRDLVLEGEGSAYSGFLSRSLYAMYVGVSFHKKRSQ